MTSLVSVTLVMLILLERESRLIERESLLSISAVFRADCEGEGVGNRVRKREFVVYIM